MNASLSTDAKDALAREMPGPEHCRHALLGALAPRIENFVERSRKERGRDAKGNVEHANRDDAIDVMNFQNVAGGDPIARL